MISAAKILSAAPWACGVGLGLLLLADIGGRSGATEGVVVNHVAESGVDLVIDDDRRWIEDWTDSPVVRVLPLGRHRIRMERDGRVFHEDCWRSARVAMWS